MGAMDNRRDSLGVVGLGADNIAGALYWNTVVFQPLACGIIVQNLINKNKYL